MLSHCLSYNIKLGKHYYKSLIYKFFNNDNITHIIAGLKFSFSVPVFKVKGAKHILLKYCVLNKQ